MAGDAQRVVATEEYAGRSCPYCRFPLKEGGELVLCGRCHAAHHADCWEENQGCSVLGCNGGPRAASTQPPPTTTTRMPVMAAAPAAPPPPASDKAAQSPNQQNGAGRGLIAAVLVLAVVIAGVGVVLLLGHKKSQASTLAAQHVVSRTTTSAPTTVTKTVAGNPTVSNPSTTAPTTTNPTTSTTTTHAAPPPPPDHAARAALDRYWQDMGNGDYSGAYNLQAPHEQGQLSEATMASDDAAVNVIWTQQAVPLTSSEADVKISFYARNQSGSDQNCRHFVLEELMINSGGHWLYDGPNATDLAAVENGNPHCP